jgi:predicted porin
MKINLRASVVAAALACAAVPVLAQSTVTIYGRVNTTVEAQKSNGVKNTVVADNNSRFGFKGAEDLGGGMKALFQLESGFDSSTGATTRGALFGREATVGLSGSLGTVKLGQQSFPPIYFTSADYVSMHNHDTGSSSDALFGLFLQPLRQSNSIAYTSPTFSGLRFQIAQSLSEKANFAGSTIPVSTTTDATLDYDNGPLHLGAGFDKNGGNKTYVLRALYEFGALTVGGYYERDKYESAFVGGPALVNWGTRNNLRLSAMYVVGASEFHANVGAAGNFSNIALESKARQYTLAYNYNLSKRTKVYGLVTRISDSAAALYAPGNFSSAAVGIRHNF